jgi:hypothetical protein
MFRADLIFALLFALAFTALPASAQSCPGENDEPAISVKTEAGPTLIVCGFEDHEVKAAKDKRAFTDFGVYAAVGEKTPQKIFSAESSETYWIQSLTKKGLQLEELWFFSDDPKPAIQKQITCTAETCAVGEAKCIFKMKKNPFPKALAAFKKKAAAGKLGEDGEELLDQIFAQAITGDKAAKEFYSKDPGQLDPAMAEVFKGNQEKLKLDCKP